MCVWRKIDKKHATYFVTFAWTRWLHLIIMTNAYDRVYTWFDDLKSKTLCCGVCIYAKPCTCLNSILDYTIERDEIWRKTNLPQSPRGGRLCGEIKMCQYLTNGQFSKITPLFGVGGFGSCQSFGVAGGWVAMACAKRIGEKLFRMPWRETIRDKNQSAMLRNKTLLVDIDHFKRFENVFHFPTTFRDFHLLNSFFVNKNQRRKCCGLVSCAKFFVHFNNRWIESS